MVAYAQVRDSDGLIVNRVAADEGAPLEAPAGFHFVEDDGGLYDIGGTLVNGVYTPPTLPAPSPDQVRRESLLNSALRQEVAAILRTGTPAEIETYVRTKINADAVTNLATAIAFAKRTETALVTIALAIALHLRQ